MSADRSLEGRNGRTYKLVRSYGTNKMSNKRWKVQNHRRARREWRDFSPAKFFSDPIAVKYGNTQYSPKDSGSHSGLTLSKVQIEKRGEIHSKNFLEESRYISGYRHGSRKLAYDFNQYKQLFQAILEDDLEAVEEICSEWKGWVNMRHPETD